MKIKWLFLFLLIGLPISIYLFLQGFGENHFAIPILHEKGPDWNVEGCVDISDSSTYQVSPVLGSDREWEALPIVTYMLLPKETGTYTYNNLKSIFNEFEDEKEMSFIFIATDLNIDNRFSGVDLKKVQATGEFMDEVSCRLLLTDSLRTSPVSVLCDRQRRIRGYYGLTDLKEVDRMITEISILIEEQNDKR